MIAYANWIFDSEWKWRFEIDFDYLMKRPTDFIAWTCYMDLMWDVTNKGNNKNNLEHPDYSWTKHYLILLILWFSKD